MCVIKSSFYMEFLTNAFGGISDDIKNRITSYLKQPTIEGWDDVHSIIIQGGFRTIWQMVIEIDYTFPRTGRSYNEDWKVTKEWSMIPNKDTLIKALKHAAEKNMCLCSN